MDARCGRQIRLGRVLNPRSGKGLIIACSHPVFAGPVDGFQTADQTETALRDLRQADGLLISPGWLERLNDVFRGKEAPACILHMDWKSAGRAFMKVSETVLCPLFAIEEAVAAGTDAVMTYLYYGQPDVRLEREEIRRNAEVARACERWGMVHIIEPRSASEKEKPESVSPAVLAAYSRIGAELGGTIIKTVHPGSAEGLEEVVEATPVPVMVAGGPGGASDGEVVESAKTIMATGAAGLVFGRKVYQSGNAAGLLGRLKQVVHGG
jgi:class I fructose-bisphosphate aldolase